MFKDFLEAFTTFFSIQNPKAHTNDFKFFSWGDADYREFMITLLQHLEPKREPKGTILYDELDEYDQVIFVMRGEVVVGFEINKERRYCMKFAEKCVIGPYNVTFNQRAVFIYTCLTNIQGFFIRKSNWYNLLDASPEVAAPLKTSILTAYQRDIRSKMMKAKKQAIDNLVKRNDHQMILSSVPVGTEIESVILQHSKKEEEEMSGEKMEYNNMFGHHFKHMDTHEK